MVRSIIAGLIVLGCVGVGGCNDNAPIYEKSDTRVIPDHILFGNSDLRNGVRVRPVTTQQDPSGILHVTLNLRSAQDSDQYVDAFISFYRNGRFVEKLGPQTFVLKGNLPDTILFNSTQPADDYTLNLDYAK